MIYLLLFLEFFKMGLFTFGGGYAMIPLMKETVLAHSWIAEESFYDFIGVCEATPGPIAINMASFVGFTQGGILGSLVATLGVVLPSFIIILLIASILKKVIKNERVQAFLDGVKPVVMGLILTTGVVLLAKAIGYVSIEEFNFSLVGLIVLIILVLITFIYKLIFKKKINNILFIVISAILGIVFSILIL